ncbi:hypothetical protein M422DRAFT_179763 [Sphaerobolus stellatus SS14]|uniref:Clp1-like protein n=1 Tax=Sphaerobolus stellatus (strain SS14) TaxID=990650 RepID=A0A0C9U0A9_SPHS4|nr:hypothetical protein M422DRAFT_179763 [Sphaerobolus stellatus SS14]
MDAVSPIQEDSTQKSVQLPKKLRRPTFRDISKEALGAVDLEMRDVPLEFIREQLRSDGTQMLSVATSTTASPPKDRLPRELEVLISDLSAPAPSHLFAIYSKTSSHVSIHPAHALILAAHCANLPSLPPSTSSPAADSLPDELKLTLPVVPLCLPSPPNFPMLLHYLYTKKIDHLLASLLPATSFSTSSMDQMTSNFAATFTIQALLTHAARVHGLWSNVVALGVFDEKLWKAMEMVWDVLVGALAKSTGATWQASTSKSEAQVKSEPTA